LPYLRYDLENQAPGPHAEIYEEFGPQAAPEKRGRVAPTYIPDLVCPDHRPPNSDEHPAWLGFVVNCGMPDLPRSKRAADEPADLPANGLFFDAFPEPSVIMSTSLLEELDGASHTLLLSENVDCGGWTDTKETRVGFLWSLEAGQILPLNGRRGAGDGSTRFARPSSYHAGGVNAALADSTTRFINEQIDERVWRQLLTSDDDNARKPGRSEKGEVRSEK
jgi:hypothetical protein